MTKRQPSSARQRFVYPTVLMLLAPVLLGAAGPATEQIINKVQDRYNSARTLSVDFTEQYSILGRSRPAETGRLTLLKQGKMRWDYTRPAGKLFISDGKQVFLYTAADNRVEKVPLKDTEDMRAPMAFLLGHLDLKREFRGFSIDDDAGAVWVEASAKTDRTPYEKVRLLIRADGAIERMKIVGRDQSLLEFAFSNEKLNPPVSAGEFQFVIPPGAKVVDAVEYGAEKD